MIANRLFFSILLFALSSVPFAAKSYELPEDLYRYSAEVNTVLDGNTLLADIDLGFGIWYRKTEVRLKGVKVPTTAEDTAKGVAAHKFLHGILKDQERILIQTYYDPTGKYDGWYAKVSIWDDDSEGWVSVNQMVLDSEHGTATE